MKAIVKYLIFSVVLFTASCTEPTDMLTVINSDGSCYREFSEYPDSAFLAGDLSENHNPFPSEVDSSWKFVWKYKNSRFRSDFPVEKSFFDSIKNTNYPTIKFEGQKNTGDFLVLARRNYKSVEELDQTFKLKNSNEWSKMKVKHQLDMKFRWFYTYYKYTESYPKIETGFTIPIENYMSKNEAQYWFTGEPNILHGMNGVEVREYIGKLEDNYRKWFNQNLWNAEYKVLITNYEKLKNSPISKEKLENLRDTIFKLNVNDTEDFKMQYVLDDYFKTKVFSLFWKSKNNPMKKYEDEFEDKEFISYFGKSFKYKLILPGKITEPNNAIVKGDTLIWKLTAYHMIPANYVIEAQSRKANVWAFILTGIILIVTIGSFIWKPKRKK